MISKELLSEVLENEVPYQVRVHKIIIKNNSLNYFYNSKDNRGGLFEANEYINIYELANKCKEWANSKGYTIINYIDLNNDEFWTCRAYPNGLNDGFDYEEIYQPSAAISVFKVCEWILDNKSGSSE